MKRTEPTVHLYAGKPYRKADDTDVRLTWLESTQDTGPDYRQAEESEQQQREEEQ